MIQKFPCQDFVKTVQQESDQVASELQKVLANLEPLLQERRLLEQRAQALGTVVPTYVAGAGRDPPPPRAPRSPRRLRAATFLMSPTTPSKRRAPSTTRRS